MSLNIQENCSGWDILVRNVSESNISLQTAYLEPFLWILAYLEMIWCLTFLNPTPLPLSPPIHPHDLGGTSPLLSFFLRGVIQRFPESLGEFHFFHQKKLKKLFFSMTPRARPNSIKTPLSDFSHCSDQQLKEIGQFGSSQQPNVSNGSPQNR